VLQVILVLVASAQPQLQIQLLVEQAFALLILHACTLEQLLILAITAYAAQGILFVTVYVKTSKRM